MVTLLNYEGPEYIILEWYQGMIFHFLNYNKHNFSISLLFSNRKRVFKYSPQRTIYRTHLDNYMQLMHEDINFQTYLEILFSHSMENTIKRQPIDNQSLFM